MLKVVETHPAKRHDTPDENLVVPAFQSRSVSADRFLKS